MTSRRDTLSLRGLTYMSLMILVYLKGVNTTACTDQTGLDKFSHVMRMCARATLTNTRMVIDTWGTGNPDVYSCTCTVTLGSESEATTTTLVVQEYPRIAPHQNCGSILTITSTKSSSHTKNVCTPILSTPTTDFGTSDMLTLTLSRADVSTSWTSGHCILISRDETTKDITVTCSEAQRKPGSSTSATTTSTTTTTTTPTTTTTTPTTTTLTTTTTTTPTTTKSLGPSPVSQTTSTPTPTPSSSASSTGDTGVEATTTGEQKGSDVGMIAGAAGGGGLLLIIIIVIIIVVIIRKRRPENRQPFNKNGGLHSYANTSTNKTYLNDEGDTITHNSLYVSAGPRNPDTNHIVTETGDMYAQVQKQEKRSTVEASDTEEIDLAESPQGVADAVVNKSKTENTTSEEENIRPSRYTNPDGLVYAEVSVQDKTPRPQSRSTSRPPPVSAKPKVDADNVVYAEVNTGV